MTLTPKILFLQFGSFSNINKYVLDILRTEFPDCKIEKIDLRETLKHNTSPIVFLINVYYFLMEYGLDIALGKRKINKWKEWFFSTSYIALYIEKKIKHKFSERNYLFTFQTQSMFNGKLGTIPHFVYTDHTTKTNLLYPDINPKEYIRSKRFINKCERRIYDDATMIFTFGNLVKNSLIHQYKIPNEKVLPVYSGSNVKHEDIQNESKYESKNILFVGVDWKRKGGPILVEIFKNVLLKHPDASLTIVGCTPKQINLPNLKIIGKIPVEHVAQYYNSSSIFCLPTLREPFGVAFVEAMSYKLPIVANNIGCIPDLVINNYNGYLIDNDIQEYANKICNLLDDPSKCRELGNNGYELAKSKFNWQKVGTVMKENIERIFIRPTLQPDYSF